MTPARRYLGTLLLAFLVLGFLPPVALGQATCAAPTNAIQAENCLTGTPASQWYVQGAGSPNIQGFTTDISVNVGQTIFFKISTPATSYRIDIHRMGYYQGNDGRFITSISPSVPLPQIQPACLTDSATGLIDCGNWGISASWAVPSTAVSGVYFARLIRLDTGEVGATLFVVRNDASHSDILEQTSDTTWQAYNNYGGNSLYTGNPVGRAFKVSYNRPVNPAQTHLDFFVHEYPIVRFLEANGYDVTYSTGVDTDRNGSLINQHKVFLSVGHDEYWSGGQRANVEAARAAGVNLAFFSGNEVFWKTRWEPSIDSTTTPYRTLVCYKETSTVGTYPRSAIDPADPPTWTGFWRDARFSPPADGGRPENALTGTWSAVSSPQDNAITVPQADGRMRFWRNTSVASLGPGQVATLPQSTLGYESDEDPDNGFRPAGLIRLSTTTASVSQYLYFSPTSGYYFTNGTETHHLTLYRAASGALVFGAGTIHWSWGVESDHVYAFSSPADPSVRQAMVNLFADMGVQPVTLQSGLALATASTDTTPPISTITSPAPGTMVTAGSQVTVSGTAQDFGGGVVGGVEVSVDGGATWHPAVGRENWSYTFTATTSGALSAQSRAVDDSGNLEVLSPAPTITTQPSNQTVTAGQTATFTAAATGSPTPTVQWQVSTGGGAFSNVSGATSTTLSFTSASSQNGNQYHAVFTNSAGTATTTAATLTVNSPTPPTITTQPANQTVTAGQTATFTAAASGSPTPTVQWQVSTDGGVTFNNVSGAASTTLSFTTALSQNGYQYRAVFTNSAGTATTTTAALTVNSGPPPPPSGTVTLQNANSNLCVDTGGSAGFTALVQSACSTSNTQKFTLTAAPQSGWYYLVSAASNLCWDVAGGSGSAGALIQQYSCVAVWPEYYQLKAVSGGYEILSANMSNGCVDVVGASTASGAHIEQNTCTGSANQIFNTVTPSNAPTITTQPANQTVNSGQTATFTAAATGSPTPTVQWQVSTDGGATFSNVSGATSTTLSFTTALSQNGNQYRALFTNSAGTATTTAATLTVNFPTPPVITTQPANQAVSAGQTATFTAAATGTPTPTVQWQVSTDGGATFGNVSGAISTTLSFTTTLSQNGNQYRAVFTNSAGSATTTAAALAVNSTPPTITTQPANQTVNAGQTATFTAAATGSPTPTVQWQVSTDGGTTFSNVSGATSTTLSFTTALSQNGNQYRAVFTNAAGTATTAAATLTVNATPSGTVALQNTNSNLCIDTGGSASFTALIQSACSTSNTQKFTLTAAPQSGWYYLVSAASNLCWDVAGGSGSAGALIQQYSCVAVWPEYYQLKAVSGGYEILSANMSNGCVDVAGASTASGAHIEQNTCTGSANQIFNIR